MHALQEQQAALQASLASLTDGKLPLAEARRVSNACRDGLAALRCAVDEFELQAAAEEAVETDDASVRAATEELRRLRLAHDGCGG